MINDRNYITASIIKKSKDPDKIALRLFSGEVLTYGEVISLQNQTQTAIFMLEIKPRERVALVTRQSLLIIPLTIGLMESATCVPLEPDLTAEQYQEYFQHLSIDYLMCERTTGPAMAAATAAGIGVINFYLEDTGRPTTIRFEILHKPKIPSDQDYKNNQTAFVFTTSGTTNRPKIVPVLYRNLADALEVEAQNYDYTDDSIQLLVVKLHLAIAIRAALRVLISNAQIIFTDGVYPKRIADALLKYPVTHLNFQPAGMLALYDYFEKNAIEYTPKHRVNISLMGAPLPSHLKSDLETRFNAQLLDVYGMTEVGVITSTSKTPNRYKYGSVGCPVFQEIIILDNEVVVKGPGVFPGYENDPEANLASFIDGWFRTGDVGYIDDDGYLFLTGRIKELINRGGEKISPYEVEEAILSLGNIKDVAVFPYPNRKGYENVGAVIVSNEEPGIGLKDLRTALKEKIKPFKLPTILYRADKIPTGSADKVQRSLLNQQLLDLGWIPESIKNPFLNEEVEMTSTQLTIVEIWKSILEQDYIALDEDFFDLGGDSLSAAEVLASIETGFGCTLPINQFFEKSTVRELADLVDATPKYNPFKHLVPIRTGGINPPLFFVHELSGNNVTYHHVAKHIDRARPIYGLNFNWQREGWNDATSIRDVALAYANEIQQIRETGPYYLAGLSIGGQIAFEIGSILAENQNNVMVFMIDTYSPQHITRRTIKSLTKPAIISIKQAPFSKVPQMVHKKIGTLYRKFILPEIKSQARLTENRRAQIDIQAMTTEKEKVAALLKIIHKNHQPVYFSGEVCYFKALNSRSKINLSYRYWRSLSKKFELFEENCRHSEFVEPERAAGTAAAMTSVIKRHEDKK